jgi:tetratricopeptide (TPR) repeat protein
MSAARTHPATAAALAAVAGLFRVIALAAGVGLVGLGALVALVALGALGACTRPAPVGPPPPLPPTVYARYLGGKLAAYQGDWAAAADALAEAAAAAPDQPMVTVELARMQVKAKRPAAARATLAAARTRWPEHPQVWLVSGDLLAADDPAAARAAYLRAIQLSPDDERGYLGLAKLQQASAAEATLRILVAHVPTSVDGHYRLAVRLAVRGELAQATGQLHAVLERDPDHIDARLDLARALRRQGQLAQAIVETRSAFDRSGQALDIAEELFWLLCEADDRVAAIDLLTLLDDDRSDADALAVLARLDRGLGRLAEARSIARRIAAIDADAGAIALAEIQLAAGDRPAAKATLAAIEDDSRFAEDAHRLIAAAALAAGDPAAALAALPDVQAGAPDTHKRASNARKGPLEPHGTAPDAENGPDAPGSRTPRRSIDSALVVALALADLGKLRDARAALAPFDGTPDHPAALLARARLAEHTGDPRAALALLDPLIRARPDLVAALNLAGYLLADASQRLGDAERYLRHARELAPGDPAILDSWGWLLLRRGDPRAAVRALDRAARFAPLEPEILVHLAAAWADDGAPRTAAATLDRAAALAPTPAVQKRIAALRQALPARDAARCPQAPRALREWYDGAMKRWLLGGVLLAMGCKNAPSEDQCKQLLDHLIDLEFKKAGATATDAMKTEIAKQKKAVSEAKATEFVEACTKKTSKIRIDCALAAADLDAVAKCDEAK